MKNNNLNISSLLGNQNLFGTASAFNLSDYASVKNGSYGKLMKAYYNEQKPSNATDKSSSVKNKKDVSVDNSGLTQMKKEADGLKSATEALAKDDLWKQDKGSYNLDKIAGAVKDFVKEYNDVIDQSSKVNSKDIAQSTRYMKSMTDTMSKALSKVGITVETDGKMSLNEDTLKNSNITSLKSLFSGTVSYGSQTSDKAGEISKAALMNSSVYSNKGMLNSTLSGMFNEWM